MFTDFLSSVDDDGNNDRVNNTCDYFDSQQFNSINSSPGNFSIYYMNSRSLCRHFFDIQDFLATLDHSFSMYGFTETWFKEAPPSYVHMNNYQLVQTSRPLKPGGGAAMFINNSLNFHIREDLMPSQDDFEAIFIEIQRANASNLIVGNVYRAPGTCLNNFHKCFDSCLEKFTSEGKLCYIMDDFNLNLLNCEGHQPTDMFANTFYSYGFLPLITKPTRITPHTATLIDNILTNSDLDITAGLLYSDISDHYPLFQLTASCFQNSVPLQKTFVTRDINSNSLHSFSCDLNSVD